jgi:hypothetical protein
MVTAQDKWFNESGEQALRLKRGTSIECEPDRFAKGV